MKRRLLTKEEARKQLFASLAEWRANELKQDSFPENYEMQKLIEDTTRKHNRVLSVEELVREYRKRKEA